MKEVAKLQIKDRTELFQATAISMGMQPNVIEKDFWVCFMLDHLFHDCKYKDAFVFKGGTSLSKSYHVIERFSEDIDLILDWRKIINDEVNPWEERSKTKQDIFNKQINSKAVKYALEETKISYFSITYLWIVQAYFYIIEVIYRRLRVQERIRDMM